MRSMAARATGGAAEKAVRFALVGALHLAVLGAVATSISHSPPADTAPTLDVRVIAERPPPREAHAPRPRPARTPAPVAAPVLAAAPAAPAPSAISVPSGPPAVPVPAANPVPPAPPALVPARFDAAYLRNPPPEYPFASRRLREQGQVLLRVRVDPQGRAKSVQVQESSGYTRLDQAAVDAVRLWQFVPARRGDEAVEDTALVPVVFRLDR